METMYKAENSFISDAQFFLWQVVVTRVIGINSVIGGFSWVDGV